MAFANNYRRFAAALLAVACSAAFFWFGNGMNPLWPLMWFAPLPVLLFASRSSWRAAAVTTFLACLLGSLSMWHYFQVMQAPASVWLVIYSGMALVFTIGVLLFRGLLLRGAWWSALLALPATWVACEYAGNLFTTHGTAGSFAYTQLRFLPFLQVASLTGPWGVTFLLLLFPSAIAIGVRLRVAAPKQAWRIVGASVGAIALVLIFGAMRLAGPSPQQRMRVGLIASDAQSNEGTAAAGTATERVFREYAAEAETLASRGAQAIVMPEKIGTIVDPEGADSDAIFQSLADRSGATIVAGTVHVASPVQYNEARVYRPEAGVVSYDKEHMLPPWESQYTPGTRLVVLRKASGTLGVEICKDMDFTPLARENGNSGVGLMLDPGWDFNIDRGWHGHIAIMRGVESGFSIAHAARNGYLTVSDDRGRILAETRSDSAPFATLIADVPAVHDKTLYLLMGDWFAWLAIGILAFAVVQLLRLRRHPPL
jgi:apolipoprotein N-acyltransferase